MTDEGIAVMRALRRAGPDDAPALVKLAREAYAPWEATVGCVPEPMAADWATVLRLQEVWVLDAPGRAGLIASLALTPAPDHLLIWSIALAPDRQHSGLGRALLAFAERRAAELGLAEIRLYTHVRMTRNIALYERAGYARTRLEDRGDRVVQHMAKRLHAGTGTAADGPDPCPASAAPGTPGPRLPIRIRSYADRDAEAVRALFVRVNRELAPPSLRAAFEAYIALALREEIGRIPEYYGSGRGRGFWVAEDTGSEALLGTFGLKPAGEGAAELRHMYVLPEARRRGVARAMLAEAERLCAAAGLGRLTLSTSELQEAALALYHNAGYRMVREEVADAASNKTVGSGLRRFHFEKTLASPAVSAEGARPGAGAERTDRAPAVDAMSVPTRGRPSNYPEPFASRMAGREKRPLGDLFELRNFGVNLTRLAPGAISSLRHRHSRQDEFVYVLEGEPTLVTGAGETQLRPGMCAGFPANGPAHHLHNRSDRDVLYLEVGDRTPGDEVSYPDDDLRAELGPDGRWRFLHKDGRPW